MATAADCEYDSSERKLFKIKGGNYINIISKFTFAIVNKIQFNDWLEPWTIHLLNDEIYTTSKELDINAIWSENRYLYQINRKNNQIIKKTELDGIHNFSDAIYLKNKIILCHVNSKLNEIRIIEFI